MRKSGSLTRSNTCANHIELDVREKSDSLMRAYAQKNVLKRLCLTDEQIPDIKGELRSLMLSRGYKWENFEQMKTNLEIMELQITQLTSYFKERYLPLTQRQIDRGYSVTLYTVDDYLPENRVVDFFGEPIEAMPDFVRVTRNAEGAVTKVCAGKLTSSRFESASADKRNLEVYALGEFMRSNYPDTTNLYVDILHLRGKNDPEPGGTYDSYRNNKMTQIHIDERTDAYYTQVVTEDREDPHVCSGSECAGCFMNNICHYEEAPIASDIEKIVRPVTDLRLTEDQEKVIDFKEGIARVNAGAGAGKTLTVSLRLKALMEAGVEPSKVALLTFTIAGASEMLERAKFYSSDLDVDVDVGNISSSTFNSFCMDIILEHYEDLGYTQPPNVISEEMKASFINEILGQHPKVLSWGKAYRAFTDISAFIPFGKQKSAINEAKACIEQIKKNKWTREDNGFYNWSLEDVFAIFSIYDAYERKLKESNLIEFDDQMTLVLELANHDPNLFNTIAKTPITREGFVEGDAGVLLNEEDYERSGYEYIIVDEFQDTNLPQIQILQKMCQASNFKGLMVVGDDSQAIYGFRDTTPEFIINFARYFGSEENPVHDFTLVENHRSTKAILDFANKINARTISHVNKDLKATREYGKKPLVKGFYSHDDEYAFIVNSIKEDLENGKKPSDIAFLARDKAEIKQIASLLTQTSYEAIVFDENGEPLRDDNGEFIRRHEDGIPSVICNRVPYNKNSRVAALCTFYESWENKTTQGYLDYANVRVHGALKGLSAEELLEIKSSVENTVESVPHTFDGFMELAQRMDSDGKDGCFQAFLKKIDIAICIDPSRDKATALKNFFRDFRLYGADEDYKREGNYEGVCLTTAHSSKGLEWDKTYVTVTKYDKLKNHQGQAYTQSYIGSSDHDEDLRLMFVASTRARKELVITGEYLLPEGKKFNERAVKNKMLMNCFEDSNTPYTYSTRDYFEYKARAAQEASQVSDVAEQLLTQIETVGNALGNNPNAPRRGRRRQAEQTEQGGQQGQAGLETPSADAEEPARVVNIDDNIDIEEAIATALAEGQEQNGTVGGNTNMGGMV